MAFDPGYLVVTGADACLAGDNILTDETGEAIRDDGGDWILTQGCGRVVMPLLAWSCEAQGVSVTCYLDHALSAGAGSITVSGQGSCAHRVVVAGSGSEMVATGFPAGASKGRLVPAGPTAMVASGEEIIAVADKTIPTAPYAYSLHGDEADLYATLLSALSLRPERGGYAGGGKGAGLARSRICHVAAGEISLTGSSVAWVKGIGISADNFSVPISMSGSSLLRPLLGESDSGTVLGTWNDSSLSRSLELTGLSSTISLSGGIAGLEATRFISASAGTVIETWGNSTLSRSSVLTVSPVAILLSGANADCKIIRFALVPAYPVTIALNGASAGMIKVRSPLPALPAVFFSAGEDAGVKISRAMPSAPGWYVHVFHDAIMDYGWGAYYPVLDFLASGPPQTDFTHTPMRSH